MARGKRIVSLPGTGWAGVYKYASFQDHPDQPRTLYDARDMWPLDASTGRRRLAVRPGTSEVGNLDNALMLATLGSAPGETGNVQLMAATSSNLYRYTSSAFSNVGAITSTSGRTIHGASYLTKLYIACDAPYQFYTYSGHAIADWTATTAGTIPPNCILVCEWSNRLVLAGDPANPHVVNLSRIDDPHDWDFAEEDTAAPVALSVNEVVNAIIPHNRQCLLIGTHDSIHILRGNPMRGGTLEKIAHVVGPISSKAWCKTADDWTYFLTRDGLYRMAPGCGSNPESVSREIIPSSLLGLEGSSYKAYLEYDVRFRGIHINVEGASAQRFWFDVEGGGFWPVTAFGSSIMTIHRFPQLDSATASGVLVATASGCHRLDNANALGGSDLAYFITGPIRMSTTPLWKNLIDEAVVVLGDVTDDTTGTLDFHTAPDAEAVVALPATRKYSCTVGTLINNKRCFPRLSGHAVCLKYTQGLTSKKFAFENASLVTSSQGRERG